MLKNKTRPKVSRQVACSGLLAQLCDFFYIFTNDMEIFLGFHKTLGLLSRRMLEMILFCGYRWIKLEILYQSQLKTYSLQNLCQCLK